MLLVYTHNLTPRVKYVFRQIFTQILGIKVNFSTDKDFFINSNIKEKTKTHQEKQRKQINQIHRGSQRKANNSNKSKQQGHQQKYTNVR